MKRTIAFILLCAAIVCALASCSSEPETHHPDGVEVVDDAAKSYLIDMTRSGNTVIYTCSLTVENKNDKSFAVKLAANFRDEYDRGIYKLDFAVGKVDGSEMVAVPANDSVTVEAVFEVELAKSITDDHLAALKKLPAISINEIEIDSDLLPPRE